MVTPSPPFLIGLTLHIFLSLYHPQGCFTLTCLLRPNLASLSSSINIYYIYHTQRHIGHTESNRRIQHFKASFNRQLDDLMRNGHLPATNNSMRRFTDRWKLEPNKPSCASATFTAIISTSRVNLYFHHVLNVPTSTLLLLHCSVQHMKDER